MSLLNRITNALPGGEFVRGAAAIAGATGAAQLIVIVASPIITRLYTPVEYGAYAVVGVFLTLLLAVASLRYELAIPLPRTDEHAAAVVGLCAVITTAISVALLPVAWLAGPAILAATGAVALSPYVLLVPFGVAAGAYFQALTSWMLRLKAFREIAAVRITQSAVVVAFQIGLGLVRAGALGLLIGSIGGSVAAVARLAFVTWRRSEPAFRSVKAQDVRDAAGRFRRFPIFSSPSIVINLLGLEAPLLWIVAAYGADTGGQFALAQRVVALPVAVLAAAVGQVYFAEAARVARDRPGSIAGLFGKTTRSLVLISAVPFVLGAIAAPWLFPVIFGEAWRTAGVFVAVLAPMYFLMFVTWPTGGTLDVLERQDLHLLRELGRLVLVGGVIVIATALHLPALQAVIALALAGSATNVLYGFVSWWAIRARASRAARAGDGPAAGGPTGERS